MIKSFLITYLTKQEKDIKVIPKGYLHFSYKLKILFPKKIMFPNGGDPYYI